MEVNDFLNCYFIRNDHFYHLTKTKIIDEIPISKGEIDFFLNCIAYGSEKKYYILFEET